MVILQMRKWKDLKQWFREIICLESWGIVPGWITVQTHSSVIILPEWKWLWCHVSLALS